MNSKPDLDGLSDTALLAEYAKTCASRGVRNSGLVVFLYEEPPQPDYYSEILRRMKEGRENEQ